MTGARKLARDYILNAGLRYDHRVIDVCSGDRWLRRELHMENWGGYCGLDIKDGYDLTRSETLNPMGIENPPDFIVSCYGLQHLLAEEARVWTLLRRIAMPSTRFIYVGRPAIQCWREFDRADPLNAYSREGFSGLAAASGWFVDDWQEFLYVGDSYERCTPEHLTAGNPNAFCATLEPLA